MATVNQKARFERLLKVYGVRYSELLIAGGTIAIQFKAEHKADADKLYNAFAKQDPGNWILEEMTWLEGNPWQVRTK